MQKSLEATAASATLSDAAARLEALGNPTRLAVFHILVRAGDEGLAVGDLQRRLGIAASTLSHHLRGLVTVGLVSQKRRKTTLLCCANYPVMTELIAFLVDECCADAKSTKAALPGADESDPRGAGCCGDGVSHA